MITVSIKPLKRTKGTISLGSALHHLGIASVTNGERSIPVSFSIGRITGKVMCLGREFDHMEDMCDWLRLNYAPEE